MAAAVPLPRASVAPTLTERFAAEVRAEMGRQRVTGSELARRAGVAQPYISRRLTLRTPMAIDDMELLARALGKSVSELVAAAEKAADTPQRSRDMGDDMYTYRERNGGVVVSLDARRAARGLTSGVAAMSPIRATAHG